jgi:hypothetical protein
LSAGASDSDGVIHLAFVVPGVTEAATRTDAKAIETFVASLADSGKPLVISGATLVTPGRPATERDELIAAGPIAARIANMRAALASADRGVRTCLVMLPRSVHGRGERHGFVPQLIAAARAKGVAGYIGDGASRWPAVHVKDAARLYRLAVEQAPATSSDQFDAPWSARGALRSSWDARTGLGCGPGGTAGMTRQADTAHAKHDHPRECRIIGDPFRRASAAESPVGEEEYLADEPENSQGH